VLEDATEFSDEIKKQKEESEDAKKSTLEMAGMITDDMDTKTS